MKKIVTTFLCAFAGLCGAHAQYNMFSDVDENGWLWFDSQEKIDKYIGICNENDYKVDPNGKPIQLVYANIYPDYPNAEVDPYMEGFGTDGELGGPGSLKGAIIAPGASAQMEGNGGGIVVCMPSCSTFSMCLSYDGSALVRMLGTTDVNTSFSDYTVVSAKYTTLFRPLFRASANPFKWEGIETLDSGNEPFFNLQSDGPIYAFFQNVTKYPMLIHGIKVTTPTNTLAVKDLTADKNGIVFDGNEVRTLEKAQVRVYGMDGTLLASEYTNKMNVSKYPKGLYIVKAGDSVKKINVR